MICKIVAHLAEYQLFFFSRDTYLAENVTDCISLLFQKLEDRHGYLMVAHSLAYITAAKNGITETEIEDLISLGQYEKYHLRR